MENEKAKLYDLFGRFSNIALFCMVMGAISFTIWATLLMGLNGYMIGFTLIIFGYLLNWLLESWETKNKIKLRSR